MGEIFLSQSRAALYLDLIIQSETLAICAGLAILIACLGLFALSAYTTERRTKEIGIRKAMGADTSPSGAAAALAIYPASAGAHRRRPPRRASRDALVAARFVYHVDLSAWTFVLAAVAAVRSLG